MIKTESQAVRRACKSLQSSRLSQTRIEYCLLTDEPHGAKFSDIDIEIVQTPKEFSPRNAKYKARALEYFRIDRVLSNDDWVLHLDEETCIDEHTLRSCLEFIERSSGSDFGQVCPPR